MFTFNIAKKMDILVEITIDEALDNIDFVDALDWYKKNLRVDFYKECLEEALKELGEYEK